LKSGVDRKECLPRFADLESLHTWVQSSSRTTSPVSDIRQKAENYTSKTSNKLSEFLNFHQAKR